MCLLRNRGNGVRPSIIISMSTKDLALRIVKDQFGVLAEVEMMGCSEIQEICNFVSNRDHPSFPEIMQDARSVFKEKVNDAKVCDSRSWLILCRFPRAFLRSVCIRFWFLSFPLWSVRSSFPPATRYVTRPARHVV